MKGIKDCPCSIKPTHQAHHPEDGSLIFIEILDVTEEEALDLYESSIDKANQAEIKKLKN